MAVETKMKRAVKRLVEIFADLAACQGWKDATYRTYFHLNPDWGKIDVILVADKFPGKNPVEQWSHVMSYLEKRLKHDPGLLRAVDLVLRTNQEVEEDGDAAIGPQFVEASEL